MATDEQAGRNNAAEGLRQMKANTELYEMIIKEMAHQYRIAYLALLREGFTEGQSLSIILEKGSLLSGK